MTPRPQKKKNMRYTLQVKRSKECRRSCVLVHTVGREVACNVQYSLSGMHYECPYPFIRWLLLNSNHFGSFDIHSHCEWVACETDDIYIYLYMGGGSYNTWILSRLRGKLNSSFVDPGLQSNKIPEYHVKMTKSTSVLHEHTNTHRQNSISHFIPKVKPRISCVSVFNINIQSMFRGAVLLSVLHLFHLYQK